MLNFNILVKTLKKVECPFSHQFLNNFSIISEHDRTITAFNKEIFYLIQHMVPRPFVVCLSNGKKGIKLNLLHKSVSCKLKP